MTELDRTSQSSIVKGNPSNTGKVRVFIDGSTRSYTALRTAYIGFGTYQPGWQWSLYAGTQVSKDSENHIGYVISGRMMVKDPSGDVSEIEAGYAFEIPAGSDAWVIGDEPCIALDFIPISN